MDQATAQYLNDNVGKVLAKAMAEMAVAQPTDGVDFLARWLKKYAEQEEYRVWQEKEDQQRAEDRAKVQKAAQEREEKRQQKAAEQQVVLDAHGTLMGKFNNLETAFQPGHWQELVEVAKTYMGASAAYLGILDEEGLESVEGPCIRYDTASQGSEAMLQMVLQKETGVTYGALKESPTEEEMPDLFLWKPPVKEPPPQEPGPDGAPVEPPPQEGLKYYPVSVKHVTDVPAVNYFDMPRLGAYIAVPLVFSSYYTQDAFAEATRFEQEKADAEKARLEAEAEKAAAAERGEEEPQEEGQQPEEPEPEKVMVLPGVTVKMVLCLDTLGTNSLFDESKIEEVLNLCNACGECKSRSETTEVDQQALFALNRREELEKAAEELIAEATKSLEESLEGEKQKIVEQALEPDAKAVQDELLQKRFSFFTARKVLADSRALFMEFTQSCFTAPEELISLVAAVAFTLRYPRSAVYTDRKAALKWPKLKELTNDALFDAVAVLEVDDQRQGLIPEHKMAFVRSLIPPDFEERAKEISPMLELLLTFLNAALDYRSAHLNNIKAEYEARRRAAEDADEPQPFTEPPLIEFDDDFDE